MVDLSMERRNEIEGYKHFNFLANSRVTDLNSTDPKETKALISESIKHIEPDANRNALKYLKFGMVTFSMVLSATSAVTLMKPLKESFVVPAQENFANNQVQNERTAQRILLNVPGSGSLLNEQTVCRRQLKAYVRHNKNENIPLSESLCNYVDESSNTKIRKDISVSILVQNPIYRVVQSFFERQDPNSLYFTENLVGMNFEEYLTSPLLESDHFTRSLLCKFGNEPLTENDLEIAKTILRNNEILSETNKDERVQSFLSKVFDYNKECIDSRNLQEGDSAQSKRRAEVLSLMDRYYGVLRQSNEFDMKLYSFAVENFQYAYN